MLAIFNMLCILNYDLMKFKHSPKPHLNITCNMFAPNFLTNWPYWLYIWTWCVGDLSVTMISPLARTAATRLGYSSWPSLKTFTLFCVITDVKCADNFGLIFVQRLKPHLPWYMVSYLLPHSPNWNLNLPSLSKIWIRWLFVSATIISFCAFTATPDGSVNWPSSTPNSPN